MNEHKRCDCTKLAGVHCDCHYEDIFPSSVMVRSTTEGKIDWSLVADGPMLRRWAVHLTKGMEQYEKRNWMKGDEGDLERFRESAFRHFFQWWYGEEGEDHGAAVFFNINGFEFVKGRNKS